MIKMFKSKSVNLVLKRVEKLAMANNNTALTYRELSDAVGNRMSVDVLRVTVVYLADAGLIDTEKDVHQIDENIEATRIWMSKRGWEKCFDIRRRHSDMWFSILHGAACALLGAVVGSLL